MHDVNGKPLNKGDSVIIRGTIAELSATDEYCNVTVTTLHGRRPDGVKERLSAINTGVLEKLLEPEAVGGFIDDMIQKYLKDALKDASFDYKVFLGHPETRKAAQSLAISLKASAKLPFDLDDRGIDFALKALETVLDQYKDIGPVKVGATPESVEARKRNSDAEVDAELRKVGIDPATIGLIATLILRYAPDIIAAIKKLFGE